MTALVLTQLFLVAVQAFLCVNRLAHQPADASSMWLGFCAGVTLCVAVVTILMDRKAAA